MRRKENQRSCTASRSSGCGAVFTSSAGAPLAASPPPRAHLEERQDRVMTV